MANNKRHRRSSTVRVLEPEIMPNEATPLSGQGKLPALQENIKTHMNVEYQRCQDAAEKLKRLMSAKADLYESALRDAERAYEQTREELRDMGV